MGIGGPRGHRPRGLRSATAAAATLLVIAGAGCAGPTTSADGEPGRAAAASGIALPEILAIELPAPGLTEIAPGASPLRELLASGRAGGLAVSHDRTEPLPIGASPVTWTAWEGKPGESPVRSTRTAYVYVFPHGQTPAGVSGYDHATAGNRSAKVVRDASGGVHVGWLDGGRPGKGHRVMYRLGYQDPATGAFSWRTDPIRISDLASEAGNAYLAMEAGDKAVHFAWQGPLTARYRRLVLTAGRWSFEPIRDTGAGGSDGDSGPDIAARGDSEVHVLTPSGRYAVSTDHGQRWRLDQVPTPSGIAMKLPALAVDSRGAAHVVFTGKVRGPRQWSSRKPNGGYLQLRYVRREPGGGWVDAQDALAAFPEWGDPRSERDVLADWADIAVDQRDNIHVAWHGTANTHIYGNDEAFYARRPAAGPGAWGAWAQPQPLHPVSPAHGEYHSFAPALSVDGAADLALAVVFFDTSPAGSHVFDSDARVLRGGTLEGPPIPLSRTARRALERGRPEDALSTWFPTPAPRVHRDPNGRAWLDVLQTEATPPSHGSPHYVVYQRLDVTRLLAPAGGRATDPASR